MLRIRENEWVANPFNEEYVQRLKDGDPETQGHFTQYFGALLTAKVRSRVRSPQLGEEVRQETFLRVLTIVRRGGVDSPERLAGLVNSICNHVLHEVYRKESRAIPMPEILPEPIDERPDPESALKSLQESLQVRRVLDSLSSKDRDLLREVFLEERDKDEVCRMFHVDRAYLRVLLHRAKERFRAAFEDSVSPVASAAASKSGI